MTVGEAAARAQLQQARIPPDLIDAVMSGQSLTQAQVSGLSADQLRELDSVNAGKQAVACCACLGLFASIGYIGSAIASFVGGLLGWVLIMKKTVLQCSRCGLVLAAS